MATINEKLADGAKDIKKAEAELKKGKPEPLKLEKLNRSVEEIVRDRVTVVDGSIGVVLSKDTTLEENMAILDWTTQMSDHVGFMIGDVLNFGNSKWGEKYAQALNQTNRALSTLKGYAEASRRIPINKRRSELSFSHHREVLRLPDEKIEPVLKELGTQAKKGELPSVMAVRSKIQTMAPRPKPKAKGKPTSGKGKGKGKTKVEAPPYQPTKDEQAQLDDAEDELKSAADLVKDKTLLALLRKLDNKERQRWVAFAEPIHIFWKNLEMVTGYK